MHLKGSVSELEDADQKKTDEADKKYYSTFFIVIVGPVISSFNRSLIENVDFPTEKLGF